MNVAEAKVIVEAIDDIARDLSSIPHPEDRYWEIAIISFYKAQANAIQRALRVSDVVEPSGWKFLDKKTKSVRIEVNVVDSSADDSCKRPWKTWLHDGSESNQCCHLTRKASPHTGRKCTKIARDGSEIRCENQRR